ncbi:ABC transporter ATP-binding protein [Deinococcus soli (ex Cha et al. 2016)]|uniref:Spermidine/putrescine import ATP-binding protein PotA n=2 Tax=Deinococcus soli (ex Cha et al. 2016) TaxID=1309411 RepID=A0AAE3XAQ5_9DEIO|nr:ABC transporter ATP-binding protein [Deinococcus soli (ex Cha et al. 2016)]MDR6217636.1 spermidine/putrescine transport system ATP-binding protein [Deinococcus soli (ex Cha et al. 2016)]MDR6326945.1 spermidine/putrescine transport system ATP-binding protein [Deinococcus soli (ex Cha et al. 2016)]MDR6750329.1 spermidine/putrescine transport system ATP-binding protein [Deinococcus soli (ex Cha et al. 2016)]
MTFKGKRPRDLADDAAVSVRGVRKSFRSPGGAETRVLDDINLDIRRGEFFSLLGPSGCGKTTLLRILAGFEQPDAGAVLIGGQDMTGVPPHRRDVNTVFQNYALFPHMTVQDNVAFGLRMKGVPTAQIRGRVMQALERVRIADFAARRPDQLSGGQRQRVALARAIVNEPQVLLLDEPLSALDLKLRKELQVELANLQESLGMTFVFVTHDQEEALVMSDRIAVMNRGRVEQLGRAEELYERPRTAFVANFLGSSNLIPGTVLSVDGTDAIVQTEHGPLRTTHGEGLRPGQSVTLSVRPEKLRMERDDETEGNEIRARVDDIVYTGAENQYLLQAGGQQLVAFQLNADIGADEDFDYDEQVALYLPPDNLVVLEEA